MFNNFFDLFLTFVIYSFFGYLLEVGICSYCQKKLVNRGFLFGPLCPIYGVGAIVIVWLLEKYYNDPIVVMILGIMITSVVEYYTGYILEKLFHNKWWDYSDHKYHLNGYICLENSIGFGIGSLFIIYIAEPIIKWFLALFSNKVIIIIGVIILVILIIDMICSFAIAYNLRSRLIIAEDLKQEKLLMIPVLLEKKYHERVSKLKWRTNRLVKAFPDLTLENKKELDIIYKWLVKFKKQEKESKKQKEKK